jgi:D-threo-aldose 1-dehydrogenase
MSELSLTRLGLGTANLGNLYAAMSDDDAFTVLEAAWDAGIRYFDTAPHYGLGLSERRLGAFLATKPRGEYVVSTKLGRRLRPAPAGAHQLDVANDFLVPADQERVWDMTPSGIRAGLEESLDRLGLDAVDIVYLHDPERFDLHRGIEEGLAATVALRDHGLVRAVGVASMATDALAAAAGTGADDVLMVAGRLTLADQSSADEVLPLCRERGIAVVAAAVYNSGLLATPAPTADARFDYRPVPAELLDRVRRIEAVCAELGIPLPVAAIHYPFQEALVRSVVVGGATADQVRQNAESLADDVTPALWRRRREEGLVNR